MLSPFVGGAFGSGLRPQYQVFLAVLAARELKRSVRVALTRQQMFSLGYRPATWQRVALGAAPDGKLEAVIHEAIAETSRFEDYTETVVDWSGLLYQCDNVQLDHKRRAARRRHAARHARAGRRVGTVTRSNARWTSSPSSCGMDPIELRLKNYAETGPERGPAVLEQGAARVLPPGRRAFRLGAAEPEPRSMRDGRQLRRVGHGERRLGGAAAARHPRRPC